MADPYVREAGWVEDMGGHRIPVGVDHGTVTIGPPLLQYRLNQVQAEEFAQLYVSACWQAGQNARQMGEEIHDADGGDTAHTYQPDEAGPVAVTITTPRRGRFLAKDEEPDSLEHRHTVHECEGTKRNQRGQWTSSQRPRDGTGRRRRPVQPPLLTP